ncbi:ankyrin repeat domain-containing protein [Apiospora kogelbergensis]|uniref:ankyrin repeat domain-containing protein n=1 Tax=Apiospora kogelbergensis TaxID=1337665 RepID=UPI00313289CC
MDNETKHALHAAAREGKLRVVESLLNADPKQARKKDDDGRLPLHWAASSNQLEIVLLLSQQKDFDPDAENLVCQDDIGWTPLMIAASVKDNEKLVELLLSRGADVNQTNHNGQTALHFVASKSNLEVARLLLDSKPPASARVRDKRGQYALHRAAAAGSVPMKLLLTHDNDTGATAVALLKAGADTDKKDSDGFLALDLAPDKEVRKYIEREAENEGIEL